MDGFGGRVALFSTSVRFEQRSILCHGALHAVFFHATTPTVPNQVLLECGKCLSHSRFQARREACGSRVQAEIIAPLTHHYGFLSGYLKAARRCYGCVERLRRPSQIRCHWLRFFSVRGHMPVQLQTTIPGVLPFNLTMSACPCCR